MHVQHESSPGAEAWPPWRRSRLTSGQRTRRPAMWWSVPLADDPLVRADEKGHAVVAALDHDLEGRAALVVDLHHLHHAPARPLPRHQRFDLFPEHALSLPVRVDPPSTPGCGGGADPRPY